MVTERAIHCLCQVHPRGSVTGGDQVRCLSSTWMGLAFGVSPIHLERSGPRTGTPLDPSWKTDAMFRRYAIVDERDLRRTVAMLAKGTTGAQSKVKAPPSIG